MGFNIDHCPTIMFLDHFSEKIPTDDAYHISKLKITIGFSLEVYNKLLVTKTASQQRCLQCGNY